MNRKMIPFLREHQTAFLVGAFFTGLIVISGCLTDIYLGDEAFHIMMVREWFLSSKRPIYAFQFDYIPEHNHYRFFDADPLWHFGLFLLWKTFGAESKIIAQIYQGGFYFLLLLGTYFLAVQLYGKPISDKALLLCATIPTMIAFSIILYIDVPLSAFSPWILFFLLKGRLIPAALLTGGMCLFKKNGFLLLPFLFLFILFYPKGSNKNWGRMVIFGGIILALLVPDWLWRLKNFKGILRPGDEGGIILVLLNMIDQTIQHLLSILSKRQITPYVPEHLLSVLSKPQITPYVPEHLFSIKNIFQYLGLPLLSGLFFYLILIRKTFEKKKDIILIGSSVIFIILYIIFFSPAPAIRHLSPTFPLLSIIACKGWISLNRYRRIKILFLILILTQFLFTSLYLYKERRIPIGIAEGFRFIDKNLPPKTRVLYPEVNMAYYTQAIPVWEQSFPHLKDLFWGDSEQEIKNMLEKYQIHYILIKKTRIYDDENIKNFGGYPKSFISRLPEINFFHSVYENQEVALFKVESSP